MSLSQDTPKAIYTLEICRHHEQYFNTTRYVLYKNSTGQMHVAATGPLLYKGNSRDELRIVLDTIGLDLVVKRVWKFSKNFREVELWEMY